MRDWCERAFVHVRKRPFGSLTLTDPNKGNQPGEHSRRRTKMNKLSTMSGAIAVVAAVAFAASSAEAARGGNGGGKGGKDTNAVAAFSEVVECDGVGGILGEIDVGSDASQCFTYMLSIVAPNGWTIFDEAPTTFDLSSEAEICAYDAADDEVDACDDGEAEDGEADGWSVDQTGGPGDCQVFASQPDSVSGPNPPPQEPEFIVVINDGSRATCDVTVWLKTVLHNKSDCSAGNPEVCGDDDGDILIYRPRSCHVLKDAEDNIFLDGEGDPVVDTFNLHTAKVFDPAGAVYVIATTGPGDPIHSVGQALVATDGDGDGTPDCIDPEPDNDQVE
jgi:hypothetical protein